MITLFDISRGGLCSPVFCAILSCLFAEWSGLAHDHSFFTPFYLLPIAQKKAYMAAWFCA
jgi:hypothetical protein